MKSLVVANQKGGVGKTSTAVHLAFHYAEQGVRTLLIDLDTQANASYTLKTYASSLTASALFADDADTASVVPGDNHLCLVGSDNALANLEGVKVGTAAAAFSDNLSTFAESFDLIIIDTAPSLGVGMAAALMAADYVVSPVELEAYSVQGIQRMVRTIANIRRSNKKLRFLGMLPSKMDARNPRHKRHLDELSAAYPKFLIPHAIGLRSSIADAMATGRPVWMVKKTAARKAVTEIRAVADYLSDQMELV